MKKKLIALLAVLAVVLAPSVAYAQQTSIACEWWNPLTWPSCILYGLGTIVGFSLGIVVILLGWLMEVVLKANEVLTQTPSVQIGFQTTLALANLGFVFGIIVIAIATIIRYQTYGLKQILWKLVVMAILINFSMTIASTIIGFADGFTAYFINNTGAHSIGRFALNFTAGFTPQKSTQPGDAAGIAIATTNQASGTIQQITALFIGIMMIAITAVVMAAMVAMLFIRYIALGILLILMPLAWLCWVFPDLKSYWNDWWNKFIRWTFFAPILAFFIYLALIVWTKRSSFIDETIVSQLAADEGSAAGALEFLKAFIADFTGAIAQQLLIVGLMVGGLFAANSLGIMGAGAAMSAAKGVAKGFGTYAGAYAGRKGLGAAGWLARKPGEVLQKGATKLSGGNLLQRGLGRVLGTVARPAVRLSGMGGEELVKKYEKEHGGRSISDLKNLASIVGGAERIAVQKLLAGKGEFNLPQTHSTANQNLWKANGMSREYNKEVEIPSGMSAEVYQMKKKQLGGDTSITDDDIQTKHDKWLGERTKAEIAKMPVKDIMSTDQKEAMGESGEFFRGKGTIRGFTSHFTIGMVNAAPDNISSVLPRFRGGQLDAFQKESQKHIDEQLQRVRQQLDPTDVTSKLERIAVREKRSVEDFLKLDKEVWSKIEGLTEEKINTYRRLTEDKTYQRLASVSKKLTNAIGANAVFSAPEGGGPAPFQPPPSGTPKSSTRT